MSQEDRLRHHDPQRLSLLWIGRPDNGTHRADAGLPQCLVGPSGYKLGHTVRNIRPLYFLILQPARALKKASS